MAGGASLGDAGAVSGVRCALCWSARHRRRRCVRARAARAMSRGSLPPIAGTAKPRWCVLQRPTRCLPGPTAPECSARCARAPARSSCAPASCCRARADVAQAAKRLVVAGVFGQCRAVELVGAVVLAAGGRLGRLLQERAKITVGSAASWVLGRPAPAATLAALARSARAVEAKGFAVKLALAPDAALAPGTPPTAPRRPSIAPAVGAATNARKSGTKGDACGALANLSSSALASFASPERASAYTSALRARPRFCSPLVAVFSRSITAAQLGASCARSSAAST